MSHHYASINPFTEELVKSFTLHTDEQVEAALTQAHAVYQSDWSRGPIETRLAVLARLADLLEQRVDVFATAMATEMGKPLAQGQGEVKLCIGIARYYAEQAKTMLAPVPYPIARGEAVVEHFPVGVLVAVEPWNFPLYQLIRVVAPAIAVGNPVLLKHAENVPQCAELFETLVRDAGAPAGVLVNLFITKEQVAALIGDDRIQGVALTGSERAGSAVAARASEMLKKSTLELGGSDVFVVLDDADVAKAAKVGAGARLSNAGQVCTAAKRFILHAKVADAFLAAFTGHMQAATMGDPMDPATTLGPLSSKGARDNLERQVSDAVAHGATVVIGGKPAPRQGFFYEPTILTGVTPANPMFYEEFFGPVAQVFVAADDDAIVAIANDSRFGLGGSMFTGDIARGKAMAARIETGMVFINSSSTSQPQLPFGGVKRSGYGRELGDLGIMEFVNKKLMVVAG
ncbi:NAD-dependent succinate-semialdehyde dehydrogenase [Massilia sp. DWR3-1-1]|uniref:NAD-dependent succinate-semialdehyde dehydrogenase n=1 Tax=Massilia sp. DWR3-1-1 TaxID=2804559 RepID=UPI003CF6643A